MRKEELIRQLINLTIQLEKLLKVIRHSDPTAEIMKHQLHKKYLISIKAFAAKAKLDYQWKEIHLLVKHLPKNKDFIIDDDITSAIINKLHKDIENEFVSKPVFDEFAKVKTENSNKKRLKPKPKKKNINPQPDPYRKKYSRDNLKDMIKTTTTQLQQHRSGTASLIKLIDKIKTLDPNKLENKINDYIKTDKIKKKNTDFFEPGKNL